MDIEVNEALPFETAGDARDEIARLEARLEQLADSLARCRKFRLLSQVAMAGGALWLVTAMIGVVAFDPLAMMLSIAGLIGGAVLYGSNATTTDQFEAEMKKAEEQRARLIGTLRLRVVGDA